MYWVRNLQNMTSQLWLRRSLISYLLALTLLLPACSSLWNKPPVTAPTVVRAPTAQMVYPRPDGVSLKSISWYVISQEDPGAVLELLEEQQAGICLPVRGYENLGTNMADIMRYIKQTAILVRRYEDDIAEANKQAQRIYQSQKKENSP